MKPPACRTGRQRGAVIITVCLTLVFLLGFMGFALDLGRLFIVKHELQTALDSCALAAAQELDGQPTAIARAVSAGQSAGNANRVNLQSANWDGKGQLTAASFQFFDASLRLHVVSCGKQHCHWGIAGANGLAGRCLSLDMRR